MNIFYNSIHEEFDSNHYTHVSYAIPHQKTAQLVRVLLIRDYNHAEFVKLYPLPSRGTIELYCIPPSSSLSCPGFFESAPELEIFRTAIASGEIALVCVR
jgi:hypothetical protein